MRATVITLLKTTPEAYETFLFDFYLDWCLLRTKNTKSLQKLLTCPPLFNWWLRELAHFENKFIEHAKDYASNLKQEDAFKLYRLNTAQMHNIFSKSLIKKAYDSKAIGEQN